MAFVHLHNHSDFSILDAVTRIPDMVKRAVEFGMPAIALTDHGNMFGVPDFDQACRKYNDAQKDMHQWKHDVECFQKGWELEEPEADAPDAALHDRVHAQWESDVKIWNETHDLDAVKANRPSLTIKPIFGSEVYFVPPEHEGRGSQTRYHLILLAKNEQGYGNLMRLMSEAANKEHFYYKPRVTTDLLRTYGEGIICLSACISGIIPQAIIAGDMEQAELWTQTYKEIFGDDFYLEIQDHGIRSERWRGHTERTVAEELIKLGQKFGVKVVATNDNHYLNREDAEVQDIASCIGTATKKNDPMRMRMQGTEFYIKSEAEMRSLFSWYEEAVDNTLEVANKCNFELDWSHMYLPKFPDLDEGETSEERFRKECEAGLARKYGPDWQNVVIDGINVKERFEYEYDIICTKGFADYFLIVQEYVRWAKQNGIGVGPGRGSAAGAIVAYAMDITSFDPLQNGLMFERFLSPQRSEMPDIDMDFDDERRLEVVEHVRQLYGSERVCHVITYQTIKAKQAVNDAARVLDFPQSAARRISKMIPSDPNAELKYVLHKSDNEKKVDQYSPELEEAYAQDDEVRSIVNAALSIEGLHRGEGVHACAVLIAPTPVYDHVPTKLDTKGEIEITQFEGHSVADMGLLKMDFLGLRTLTVISKALRNIKESTGDVIDVDKIPFDDPEIFALLSRGHTAGVFQVESQGMTATIKNMHPREYKQIVALIALYRPGPLNAGMVTDYIDRMNGRKEVVYYDDRLANILSETYGTIVYQEQVMQISMKMSGFSAGESDKVRKAVAKKKLKLMTETVQHWDDGNDETMQDHWMNGAVRNGYKREIAEGIWRDVLKFASYAFNKSHSAGYAILVMQTAWLKAHYPREFMASVLTSYMGKTDKIVHYVSACKHEGIQVKQPDINESGPEFTATPDGIRFGLAGIRGVGYQVAEQILEERREHGNFENLHDFVKRMSQTVRRSVIEALIKAGAFDSTGYTRKQLWSFIDKDNDANIIDAAVKQARNAAVGQISMFDMFGDMEGSGFENSVPEPDGVEWDRFFKLSQEFEVMGIYVSDHPLKPYEYALANVRDYTMIQIEESDEIAMPDGTVHEEYVVPEGKSIRLAGMLSDVSKRTTKNGDIMAILQLEDMEGFCTCVVFPKLYQRVQNVLFPEQDGGIGTKQYHFVQITGKLERGDRGDQIICEDIHALAFNNENNTPRVLLLDLPMYYMSRAKIGELTGILQRYPGLDYVQLQITNDAGERTALKLPIRVDLQDTSLIMEINDVVAQVGSMSVGQYAMSA